MFVKKRRIASDAVKEKKISGVWRKEKKMPGAVKEGMSALKKWRATLACTLLSAAVLNLGVSAAHRAFLQRGIAEEVLRFHVLANSDSAEDQRVKYLVRDAVLAWIDAEMEAQERISAETEASEEPDETQGQRREAGTPEKQQDGMTQRKIAEGQQDGMTERESAEEQQDGMTERENELQFLREHLREIGQAADQVLAEQGMDYRAEASVENCYFPERTYGDCTFPAGWYDALRLRLGAARGQNWWCVLYPGLCFSDCLHGVVDGEAQADLRSVLTAEEYESLLRQPKRWKIGFRWFSFFSGLM